MKDRSGQLKEGPQLNADLNRMTKLEYSKKANKKENHA